MIAAGILAICLTGQSVPMRYTLAQTVLAVRQGSYSTELQARLSELSLRSPAASDKLKATFYLARLLHHRAEVAPPDGTAAKLFDQARANYEACRKPTVAKTYMADSLFYQAMLTVERGPGNKVFTGLSLLNKIDEKADLQVDLDNMLWTVDRNYYVGKVLQTGILKKIAIENFRKQGNNTNFPDVIAELIARDVRSGISAAFGGKA